MNPTRLQVFQAVRGIIVQPWPPTRAFGLFADVGRYNPPDDPMSLLSANDLAKSYGAQDVFRGVSLSIAHQTRTALVGPNGVGKSTLLALLVGHERPDRGRIQRARGVRIGHLPQDGGEFAAGPGEGRSPVWEFCLEAFGDLRRQEQRLADLEAAMGDARRTEEALAAYGPLQEKFEREGGYLYPARLRQVLRGLGVGPDLWDRALVDLSGGEFSRVGLARLLLEDPGLLLLDEPTAHLDLEAVEWLEGWLREWPGAALIVSHDRYFLDRTVTAVWELSADGLTAYPGDYSAYMRQRSERLLARERSYASQRAYVSRESDYIRRNIAGQNTRQAKGRRKRLERFLRDEALERPVEPGTTPIVLKADRRGSEKILETNGLVVAHPSQAGPLFAVPDLMLDRGECVAVLGPNGAGKTSLLRTVLGESPPLAGTVRLGSGVRPGYLSQTEGELSEVETVLAGVWQLSPDMKEGEARRWLARFGLAQDAEKQVGELSGGERRRLALARLALAGSNLLLLDEPTNNLDLTTQESLQSALEGFPETILLVTHDRYLAQALATQIWAISPGERSLEVFRGGYGEYVQARLARRTARPASRQEGKEADRRPTDRRAQEVAVLESRVEQAEAELAALARDIDAAGADVAEVTRLGRAYARKEDELESLLRAWEAAAVAGPA